MVDLPEVGRNLQDHLMSGLSVSVSPGLSMDPLAIFYPSTWTSLARGKGPLTHTGCDGIAFVRTESQEIGDPRPDVQFHMIAVTLATDRGMVMKDLIGFKPDDPVDPWWQPHVGKDTFTLAPTLLRCLKLKLFLACPICFQAKVERCDPTAFLRPVFAPPYPSQLSH